MSYTSATEKKDEAINNAKKAGRQFEDAGRQAVNDVKNDLASAAHNAGQEVRRRLNTAVEKAEEVTSDVESRIRNKPVESTLLALGAGFLIGFLARR